MIYDYIILGGGISGLYSAYELIKRNKNSTILLLEKYEVLGGRVDTYTDKHMSVEAGAGRFHSGQARLNKLIRELGLEKKISPISSEVAYAPADSSGVFLNSILDAPDHFTTINDTLDIASPGPVLLSMLDVFLGKQNIPNAGLLTKVLIYSKTKSADYLRNIVFIDFIKKVLHKDEVKFIEDSFGYYSELVVMNAYDALQLIIGHLSPDHSYYGLKGGLSQIIHNLEQRLAKFPNVRILKNREVDNIDILETCSEVSCSNVEIKYKGHRIICALPKNVLEKLSLFRKPSRHVDRETVLRVKKNLDKIVCAPLCRIYSKFPPNENGEIWFKGLPKLTTNNNLRMIIPIDSKNGVIMSSYTDNKYADFWKKLYGNGHEKKVNNELIRLLKESTGVESIPYPIESKVFYWGCGVGYWGIGANSKEISAAMIQPFGKDVAIYVCGEHFSEKNQQWIEGALETSENVICRIFDTV